MTEKEKTEYASAQRLMENLNKADGADRHHPHRRTRHTSFLRKDEPDAVGPVVPVTVSTALSVPLTRHVP